MEADIDKMLHTDVIGIHCSIWSKPVPVRAKLRASYFGLQLDCLKWTSGTTQALRQQSFHVLTAFS